MYEQLPIVGTKMFCPDCGRMLIDIGEDGRAIIFGKTTVRGQLRGDYDEDGVPNPPDDCVITDAFCERRPCRLRRWLHSKGR